MYVRAIALHGSRIGSSRPRADRIVDEAASGRAAGDRNADQGHSRPAGRDVIPVGPSPSTGPRRRPELAPGFVTQLAATGATGLATGDRRSSPRNAPAVVVRADAAYRSAIRLTTMVEPGFLYRRSY
jgi:hypothetical protein